MGIEEETEQPQGMFSTLSEWLGIGVIQHERECRGIGYLMLIQTIGKGGYEALIWHTDRNVAPSIQKYSAELELWIKVWFNW